MEYGIYYRYKDYTKILKTTDPRHLKAVRTMCPDRAKRIGLFPIKVFDNLSEWKPFIWVDNVEDLIEQVIAHKEYSEECMIATMKKGMLFAETGFEEQNEEDDIYE